MTTVSPPQQTTPPWPSLYDLGLDIIDIEHHEPIQSGASYLFHSFDVFRFTLYWSLIFYTPFFVVCGTYAFLNLAFPPSRTKHLSPPSYPLTPLTTSSHAPPSDRPPTIHLRSKPNERRSRVTFAVLVLLTFLTFSVAGSVVGSAIIGYVVVGLFKAANYNISTWIPFLWSLIQVTIGLLGAWPSIIDII